MIKDIVEMPAIKHDTSSSPKPLVALGEAIALIRKEKGVKQQDLAAKIEVSDVYLRAVEKGREIPSFSLIIKAAEGLGIRPLDIFERAGLLSWTQHDEILNVLYQVLKHRGRRR